MMYKIYKFILNGVVVYVGQTKLSLSRRKSGSYKGTCVEKIHHLCQIELIEETDDIRREMYWIEYYKSTALNVLNGDGFDSKLYLIDWEEKNKVQREQYRTDRKPLKKEYDRQRYEEKKKLLKNKTA